MVLKRIIPPRRKLRLLASTFVWATLAAIASFYIFTHAGWGRDAEFRSIDWRFGARGATAASSDVVILGIDNDTDKAFNERFPYPRSTYATAIDRLEAAGAAAIVFDIQFLQSTVPAEDQALVEAAARSGHVILATAPEGRINPTVGGSSAATASSARVPATSSMPLPFRGVQIAGVDDPLAASNAVVANAQQLRSADDVHRWIPPIQQVPRDDGSTQRVPSLSLAALAMADNKSPFDYRGLPDRMAINFHGSTSLYGEKQGFRYQNFANLFTNAHSPDDLAWVKGKIVLIGATSAVLQDLHETPFAAKVPGNPEPSRLMPGVEIHAHAIDTLRDRSWLRFQSDRSAALMTVLLVLLVWLAMSFTRIGVGIVVAAGTFAGFVWYARYTFDHGQYVVQFIPAIAAVSGAALVTMVVLTLAAYRERRWVKNLFSRYVSGDVVNELLDVKESIDVHGERREVSILFSDIRSFTSLSEDLDPAELVLQLNEYFEEMLEAIEFERGTFDKFIGDGLMAIFGAPLHMPDHAERACNAALDMIERLDRLNEDREDRGLLPLKIGIGIHTGEAIIGNIGSPSWRVDYTAIGDAVNLASRLESSTKELGVQILVSRQTVDAASSQAYAPRGAITVKGRSQATEVFELLPNEEGVRERDPGQPTERAPEGAQPSSTEPGQAA